MDLKKPKRNPYYTMKCSKINRECLAKNVTVAGWIANKRDHGGLLFLDLRDSSGLVQCIVEYNDKVFEICNRINIESVVQIEGIVHLRPRDTVNQEMASGETEIKIDKITILSEASTLPFHLQQEDLSEELRLKWRFLDLRRNEMQDRLKLRAEVVRILRREIEEMGFIEIHTPLLTASSPEGARDYVVPSRLNPGKFYVLPQAPQQFKQLLMVGGVDRYYQIAPCFRDEDPRADRAPGAFYQLDLEMSFAEQEDVLEVVEKVLHKTFSELSNFKINELPFPRITYKEAMSKYATDKPDLRNPLEYEDVTEYFRQNTPNIFRQTIQNDGLIYMLQAPDLLEMPRSFFDQLEKEAKALQAKGLGYVLKHGNEFRGPMANILPKQVKDLITSEGAFFIADSNRNEFYNIAGKMRNIIAKSLNLIKKNTYEFCWIVDFPMYERDDDGKWDFSHNPFSMPQGGMEALEGDPAEVLAWQYDIVCNGHELSSGAVRNYKPEIMYKAFEIVGYSKEEVDQKFGTMINAFNYGAPPHAGCAPGIDRIVMLLANVKNLREIIPFPLNARGMDLMMHAPSELSKEQLEELGLEIVHEEEELT